MPSPVGHALAGYAVGTAIAGPLRRATKWSAHAGMRWRILLFAGLACLPDVDFLFGTHATYTHSVGAIAIVAALLALSLRPWTLVVAGTLVYASHPFLDWLGRDTTPPIGIMVLWPFSTDHFMVPVPILTPVSRRYWLPNFWSHNLKVVTVELLVFGGLALAAHRWRGRS
jgi:LexA-binding, inner membrane-associated putative hydrolase